MSMFKRNGDNVFIPKEYDDDDDEDFSDLRDISDITCVSDTTNVSDVTGVTGMTDVTDDMDVSYIPPKKKQQNECKKMDIEIATQSFEMLKINKHTYNIMNEFNNEIDCTKAYSFKELSEVLKQIFSANPDAKKQNDTKKRKPSAYNNYIKIRMNALKIEYPDRPGNENMAIARSEWRNFSQDQKETYK
jgi:hypothetical protein